MVLKYLHLVYALLISAYMLLSVKEWWWIFVLVFGLLWTGSSIFYLKNSYSGMRLTRVCLCVILAIGLLALGVYSYLLIGLGLVLPKYVLIGLIITQMAFTIPALLLLLPKYTLKKGN